ncbi:MAG: PEP-CTERM sorting domain-containing protein [Phycisphaerales bacterium]|nr:PEP-CTERM sorting domain-containing protein [Phycisphaerales bacterium]MCB9854808.1 PEP-CTERM sorting domain-containing protein [Phycisphaerales bacterium]MCB9863720.1 PEP-CTERM sorting domain-containing protein [Phycisphaerales bacterium]
MGQDVSIRISAITAVVFSLFVGCSAFAGPADMNDLIVVDHQPTYAGGGASDTRFYNMFDEERWQRVADDFELDAISQIGTVRWFGFYYLDNPPTDELFHIRVYGARVGDGLPDDNNIIYEQDVANPLRIATGERVAVSVGPYEYLYESTLNSAVLLQADTQYWLEIYQIGDLDPAFLWEFSQADGNGLAFINATTIDWRATSSLTSDTAYQLIAVPEPDSLLAFLLAAAAMGFRRRCH